MIHDREHVDIKCIQIDSRFILVQESLHSKIYNLQKKLLNNYIHYDHASSTKDNITHGQPLFSHILRRKRWSTLEFTGNQFNNSNCSLLM